MKFKTLFKSKEAKLYAVNVATGASLVALVLAGSLVLDLMVRGVFKDLGSFLLITLCLTGGFITAELIGINKQGIKSKPEGAISSAVSSLSFLAIAVFFLLDMVKNSFDLMGVLVSALSLIASITIAAKYFKNPKVNVEN